MSRSEPRALAICPHPLNARMAGSNIRAMELARQLASRIDTTLAVPPGSRVEGDAPFTVREADRAALSGMVGEFDLVLSNGTDLPARTFARPKDRSPAWIFDFYNPFLLEALGGDARIASRNWPRVRQVARLTRFLLRRADLVLCASEQQRDFWIGAMYAAGVFRHAWAGRNDQPESWARVVPLGHPGDAPEAGEVNILRGVFSGLEEHDRIVLWNGGLWDWLDPLTLVRAVAEARGEHPEIKLVFLAGKPPQGTETEMARRARELARDLGEEGDGVVFVDEWIPYEKRAAALLEADLAVCLAPDSLENLMSYRTRLLDAVWTATPMICTRRGFPGDWIESNGGGLTVRAGDARSVRDAIVAALEPEAQRMCRADLESKRGALAWSECVRPLMDWIEQWRARDDPPQPEPRRRPWIEYMEYKIPSMMRWP